MCYCFTATTLLIIQPILTFERHTGIAQAALDHRGRYAVALQAVLAAVLREHVARRRVSQADRTEENVKCGVMLNEE